MFHPARLHRCFCTKPSTGYVIIALFFAACTNTKAEQYGFITRLGNDTVSVESVSRKGNTVTSDEVDRFPRVRIRHTVVELNDDGSIHQLTMDITTPSEPAGQRKRRVVATVTGDKVHLSKTDSTGTVNRDFATEGGIVEAHVPQMYSLYELYFAAALQHARTAKLATGTPVAVRQFYIDREFDRFPLGTGHVTDVGNGKATIRHDWLSGTGEATLDSNKRLISYSGVNTTYKVSVQRLATPPDVTSFANRYEAEEAKGGEVHQLSVRDTVRANIGNANFVIDYGRPLMRGRNLLGDVIAYDHVWRTGANQATQFTTDVPVKLGTLQVPAGTYSLWTIPHQNSVELVANKQNGQWGTQYNGALNLGKVTMQTETIAQPVEAFTINITSDDNKHGALVMQWGLFKWSVAIALD